MSERSIEQSVYSRVRKAGGLWLKLSPVAVSGLPDRMLLLPYGLVTFFEIKADKGKLSPKQGFIMRKLKALGFEAYVTYGYEELHNLIQQQIKYSEVNVHRQLRSLSPEAQEKAREKLKLKGGEDGNS